MVSSEMDHITCEWDSINKLLGGGLRRGTSCLLEELGGEARGVSGFLGVSFLLDGIDKGEGAILLLSEHTVDEYHQLPPIQKLVSKAKPNQLLFMDALSSLTFAEPMKPTEQHIIRCSNVRYAPKFYEELRNTVKSFEKVRIFTDSLSVLLHAMESDRAAWRFWLTLLPLIRHRGITIISSFYPEMHSHQFAESIERISDTIMRFSSPPSEAGQKPLRKIQVIKHRGMDYDDKVYLYERKDFEFIIHPSKSP